MPPMVQSLAWQPIEPSGRFGAVDWAVVGVYMLVLAVSGWLFSRREPAGASEYFLAGRRMPAWAVAVSVIASSLSVATFIGAPESAYNGDLTYLSASLGGVVAAVVVAAFFIPAFYRHDCTSIYELIGRRFGPRARRAASGAFMAGRVLASGARVYIAAIPLSVILFGAGAESNTGALTGAIAALCVVGIFYTLVGGIASVIWTDVIQIAVLLVSVLAAVVVLWLSIPGDAAAVVETLSAPAPGAASKLTVMRFDADPTVGFTLWTALLGFSLINMAAYGADHDLVQRMLTCTSAARASRSVLSAIAIGIPITTLFLLIGLLLFVYYQGPGSTGPAPSGDKAFIRFVIDRMPPGVSGLMVAGLFAVALGSLNSAINAMAATFVKDYWQHWFPGRTDRQYLIVGRWAVAGWGVALGAVAAGCIWWRQMDPRTSLIDLALSVMTFCYSGLLAVFLAALFTRRGSGTSAIAALVTGFVVVVLFSTPAWMQAASAAPGLFGLDDGQAITASALKERLPWLRLAYPWHMLIATALALGVCCLGRSGPEEQAEGLPAGPSKRA
ncbi:MAG: sodium/solute symporter [Phycisphaeraceae bacterium]|nr:sodium/solute symporter [Phycisphaeraceae bacterium]